MLIEQARRIQTGNLESNPEPADRADVTRAYDEVLVARVAVERLATGLAVTLTQSIE